MVHNVASQDGHRVVVTGGTKGIGRAITARLAADGARVVVAARSAPGEELPAGVHFVPADLTTEAGADALAEAALAHLGGVDVIVNNAGGLSDFPGGTVTNISEKEWDYALQLNLMAAVRLDRALLPGMLERGHGVIIHISSIAALQARTGMAHYGAAKAALNAYSKALATEVAPQGVRVNRIAPGMIHTEAVEAYVQHVKQAAGGDEQIAWQQLFATVDGIPVGRPGKPAEIANLVAFLVSDQAEWIIGSEFRIDGGSVRHVV